MTDKLFWELPPQKVTDAGIVVPAYAADNAAAGGAAGGPRTVEVIPYERHADWHRPADGGGAYVPRMTFKNGFLSMPNPNYAADVPDGFTLHDETLRRTYYRWRGGWHETEGSSRATLIQVAHHSRDILIAFNERDSAVGETADEQADTGIPQIRFIGDVATQKSTSETYIAFGVSGQDYNAAYWSLPYYEYERFSASFDIDKTRLSDKNEIYFFWGGYISNLERNELETNLYRLKRAVKITRQGGAADVTEIKLVQKDRGNLILEKIIADQRNGERNPNTPERSVRIKIEVWNNYVKVYVDGITYGEGELPEGANTEPFTPATECGLLTKPKTGQLPVIIKNFTFQRARIQDIPAAPRAVYVTAIEATTTQTKCYMSDGSVVEKQIVPQHRQAREHSTTVEGHTFTHQSTQAFTMPQNIKSYNYLTVRFELNESKELMEIDVPTEEITKLNAESTFADYTYENIGTNLQQRNREIGFAIATNNDKILSIANETLEEIIIIELWGIIT